MKVKCLMLKQPWAWLVATGRKTVETRTWRTRYRGPLAIGASLAFDQGGYALLNASSIQMPYPRDHVFGAIIATVNLSEIVRYTQALVPQGLFPYTEGEKRYGWILDDTRMLAEPVPVKGQLGLFDVDLPVCAGQER